LLYDRQQRSGSQAKRAAQHHASQTIADANAPNHFNQLRHDAAEAILVGDLGRVTASTSFCHSQRYMPYNHPIHGNISITLFI
jgi:cytochrome c1